MKITEKDVVRAYTGLVRVCVEHMCGVEREDALSVAKMGLLYAIRTWRAGMDFEQYAKQKIKEQLAEFKRDLGRQKRAESMFSLNDMMNPSAEKSGTYADVLAVAKMDETMLDVALFLRTLLPLERQYIRLRMDGYNDQEIAGFMWFHDSLIVKMRVEIQGKAAEYFGMVEGDIPKGGEDCG